MGRKKLGVRRYNIKLNLRPETDSDLIELLDRAPSRSGLVKERLRTKPQVVSQAPASESAAAVDEQAPAVQALDQFTF